MNPFASRPSQHGLNIIKAGRLLENPGMNVFNMSVSLEIKNFITYE